MAEFQPEILDSEVLVEKIEYLYDTVEEGICELHWSRATVDGWVLYQEDYGIQGDASNWQRFVRRTHFIHDATVARLLYETLSRNAIMR